MDKDLLRIVIIVIGATVVVGMLLWSYIKNKNEMRDIDFYDKGNPLDNIDKSLILDIDNDDFDIVPLGSALDENIAPDPVSVASKIKQPPEKVQKDSVDLPKIIQFCIVATADEGFNGIVLVDAFEQVGLEYGSMKVFERLDEQRRVDFTVASMVEPGIFPKTNLESFNSPGIVFYLQPLELDQPLPIFDDFIQTINLLADMLEGVTWDHNREPLTDETIQMFRVSLER